MRLQHSTCCHLDASVYPDRPLPFFVALCLGVRLCFAFALMADFADLARGLISVRRLKRVQAASEPDPFSTSRRRNDRLKYSFFRLLCSRDLKLSG